MTVKSYEEHPDQIRPTSTYQDSRSEIDGMKRSIPYLVFGAIVFAGAYFIADITYNLGVIAGSLACSMGG